jgi:hypothetical protein
MQTTITHDDIGLINGIHYCPGGYVDSIALEQLTSDIWNTNPSIRREFLDNQSAFCSFARSRAMKLSLACPA